MKIRLPQREDVWSVKERYCIDRGHQPSKVGPASGQQYHRLHSGSKHGLHVFARSGAINPSELATEESPSGWVGHEVSSSLGFHQVRSAIFVLAISLSAGVTRKTTSGTTKRCHHRCTQWDLTSKRSNTTAEGYCLRSLMMLHRDPQSGLSIRL